MRKILFLLAFSALVLSAEEKIAYVNMGNLFGAYYKTAIANVSFEQKKQEYQEKMILLRKEVEEAAQEVKRAEEAAQNELLAPSAQEQAKVAYKARTEVFFAKRDAFEKAKEEGMTALRKAQFETETTLGKDLMEQVRYLARSQGYTTVLDISGQTLNRMPIVLLWPEEQEITNQAIAFVNKGHDKEHAAAKEKLAKLRAITESRNK